MEITRNSQRFSNLKLNNKLVDRLMQPEIYVHNEDGSSKVLKGLTNIEIDLLFLLAHKQNAFGQVRDLYYLDCINVLNISHESFYNAVEGLVNKGFVYANSNGSDGYWHFTIIDNIFLNEEHDKKGYLDMNLEVFYSEEFKALKANEKRLVIKLIRSNKALNGLNITRLAYSIGLKTVSHIYKYLERIKNLVPFIITKGVEGDQILIPQFIATKEIETERERFIKNLLFKLGRKYNLGALNDPAEFMFHFKQLLGKFNYFFEDLGHARICYIIESVVSRAGLNQKYIEWALSRAVTLVDMPF